MFRLIVTTLLVLQFSAIVVGRCVTVWHQAGSGEPSAGLVEGSASHGHANGYRLLIGTHDDHCHDGDGPHDQGSETTEHTHVVDLEKDQQAARSVTIAADAFSPFALEAVNPLLLPAVEAAQSFSAIAESHRPETPPLPLAGRTSNLLF